MVLSAYLFSFFKKSNSPFQSACTDSLQQISLPDQINDHGWNHNDHKSRKQCAPVCRILLYFKQIAFDRKGLWAFIGQEGLVPADIHSRIPSRSTL